MGACASKPKTVEGKAPQEEVLAQQTPKVAPDTTTAVSADQTPEKLVEEDKEEEPASTAVPTTDGGKAETGTSEPEAIDNKEAEVIQEKIVVEEKEKPSASPVVVEEVTASPSVIIEEENATPSVIEEETAAASIVEEETAVSAIAEEKPLATNIVVEVVEDNTKEVTIKNAAGESEGEEKLATQQS